jgi:Tfp pilus assembly protein PilE
MNSKAFTLAETLVVVGVVAVLTAVTVPSVSHYIMEAKKAREISSARKLISAYLTYPSDHDGKLMAGYQAENVTDATGKPLAFPANARYPWRLAQYMDYDMSAILFNGNEKALLDKTDFHYAASVSPNLGMNTTFVGGDFGSGSDLIPSDRAIKTYGNFCVMRLGDAIKPSQLIVFASARRSKDELGFYQVRSPYLTSRRWASKWDPDAPASAFGYVDCRYKGNAVVAMLDGHVELMSEDRLDDMRYWSNLAQESDDPHHVLRKVEVLQ